MITISSKRIKGSGQGTAMNFPTVNFILDKLPSGIEPGLYAVITTGNKGNSIWPRTVDILQGLSLISKHRDQFRVETHIPLFKSLKSNLKVDVGDTFSITILSKLREPIKTKDVSTMIVEDIKLLSNYFDNFKTCLSCELCYIQNHGYSNYTVEGSNIGCYANVFEENDFSYGDTIEQYTSSNCKYMIPGSHWVLDVDGENERPTDEWIKMTVRDQKIKEIIE